MDKIHFGIIGCGQISRNAHIPNLRQTPEAEITTVTDRCEENRRAALAMVPGAKGFADYKELKGY